MLFCTSGAFAQGYAIGVLERMQDHNSALRTLTADLRREKKDSGLRLKTLDQTGKLSYVPAEAGRAYVFIEWRDPEEVLLVVKSTFWMYKKGINQYYYGSIDKSNKPGGSDALSFLTKSKKELTDEYRPVWLGDVKVEGTEADHMRLEPKVESKFKSIELVIDKQGMLLKISITEKNNDTSTLSFSNIKKDVRLNADIFRWRPPSDAKKIDV
ncbi:MAG: outer membrane lipoprotein carrier protein LolA [Aridibacter famidurans]|nr:outer membrane lipoprotein carrier protein LolA [Aridibacter famidurans]